MASCANCSIYGWKEVAQTEDGKVAQTKDGKTPALRSCSACKALHYCSKACQVNTHLPLTTTLKNLYRTAKNKWMLISQSVVIQE